jgi:hypothetical protein
MMFTTAYLDIVIWLGFYEDCLERASDPNATDCTPEDQERYRTNLDAAQQRAATIRARMEEHGCEF